MESKNELRKKAKIIRNNLDIKNISLFIKFVLVGILNTLFGYSVFALLLWLDFHYSIATIFSTIIGVIFNFYTTGRLVFKNTNNLLIFKFVLVYVFTTSLSIFILYLSNKMNFNLYYAGFVLSVIMALISFILQKTFVFKEK